MMSSRAPSKACLIATLLLRFQPRGVAGASRTGSSTRGMRHVQGNRGRPPLWRVCSHYKRPLSPEEQPISRRRQGTVLVHGEPARHPRFPLEAPLPQMGLERGRKGRDQELKLVECHAGHIEELRGAGLQSVNGTLAIRGASFGGRHSIPQTVNRDKLRSPLMPYDIHPVRRDCAWSCSCRAHALPSLALA